MAKNFTNKNIIKGRWYNINKKIKFIDFFLYIMVGDIGFEPMASSMSPRHSTPELIAHNLLYKL